MTDSPSLNDQPMPGRDPAPVVAGDDLLPPVEPPSAGFIVQLFLVPALAVVPLLYLYPAQNDLQMLKWGIFVAGLLTVGQFSFWGNYLPRAFPIHLRGTGESFAANIGGRVLGTSAALATTTLAPWLKQQFGYENPLAMAACFVALFACACGTILSFWLPEPAGDDLPE